MIVIRPFAFAAPLCFPLSFAGRIQIRVSPFSTSVISGLRRYTIRDEAAAVCAPAIVAHAVIARSAMTKLARHFTGVGSEMIDEQDA